MSQSKPSNGSSLGQVLACICALLAVFLVLSIGSYHPAQVSGHGDVGSNLCGSLGAGIAHTILGVWGAAGILTPLLLALAAVACWRYDGQANNWMRFTGAILLLPITAGLMHLIPASGLRDSILMNWDQLHLQGLGGSTGWLLCGEATNDHAGGLLTRHLATGGSLLVLLAALVGCLTMLQISLLLRLRQAVSGSSQALTQAKASIQQAKDLIAERVALQPASGPSHEEDQEAPKTKRKGKAKPKIKSEPKLVPPERNQTTSSIQQASEQITRDSTTSLDANDLVARIRARRKALERDADSEFEEETASGTDSEMSAPAPEATTEAATTSESEVTPTSTSNDTPRTETSTTLEPQSARSSSTSLNQADAEVRSIKVSTGAVKKKRAPRKRQVVDKDGYKLPPVDLLEDAPDHDSAQHEAETLETSSIIEELFGEFNINVKVVAATRGPTITMYELELQDAGMRVSKVAGFEKELSLKLGTDGIRIVAPLPNKKTIGIEVPNRLKVPVVMKDLVDEIDPDSMTLPVIIGRDVIGRPMVGDLSRMPHLLIAGATGTGKSVCLNAIISSILLFRSPEETRFIMVDPKMVELAGYDGIPHLLSPPITDMTKAHAALEWCCKTMDERFFALRMTGCRDIHAFNKLGAEEIARRLSLKGKKPEDIPGMPDFMPFLVVVVDEYADLMMVNKDVEKSLVRLTAKARACGIHVVLATQRPSADVVTGLIKSNLPTRICCRVADKNNSRVVLDAGGAENLLGRGDMLYLAPGTANLARGQGVWVQDHEIDAVIEHARSEGEPDYDESITAPGAISTGAGGSGSDASDAWLTDVQFHGAVWNMYKYNRSGADFLRRRMGVGYNKATKYVEWLEDLGFLGPAKGSRPRDFLKSWDDWLDELKANGLTWSEEDEIYTNPFA